MMALQMEQYRHLHFLGICGKAMGGIAAALARQGWSVSGSDAAAYPPMTDYLRARGVPVRMAYAAANVPDEASLVVVGKRIRDDNPELRSVLSRGLPYCSFPMLLRDFFLCRSRNVVVAGGVGKTTTSAMVAWILEKTGLCPDYLIGGIPRNLGEPARLAGKPVAVLEGDEYASCFDDPEPKFVHYRPEAAVITNVLEDHPDQYRNGDEIEAAFAKLATALPEHGLLVLSDQVLPRLARSVRARVVTVGFSDRADVRIDLGVMDPERSLFRLGTVDFELTTVGRMNVLDAALAATAARHFGVEYADSASALATFEGVFQRQELCLSGPISLVSDKASHPHAVTELAGAMRQQFPGRPLVGLIQPRATGGRHWIYQQQLPASLSLFDRVFVMPSYEHDPAPGRPWAREPFCIETLIRDLRLRGAQVVAVPDPESLQRILSSNVAPRDVIVSMLPEQFLSRVMGLIAALSGSAA